MTTMTTHKAKSGPGRLLALLLFVAATLAAAGQARALEVPLLTGPVNDRAEILTESARQRLTAELETLRRETGIQMVALTIPSLEGDALEDFTIRTATKWGLGKKGVDKGVLLLVAMRERDIRIEVGYGLEGTLTDLLCGRIIREEIAPAFRAGHPGAGLENGLAALMRAAQTGEFAPSEAAQTFAKMEPAPVAGEQAGDESAKTPSRPVSTGEKIVGMTSLLAPIVVVIVMWKRRWWESALACAAVGATGGGIMTAFAPGYGLSIVWGMLAWSLFVVGMALWNRYGKHRDISSGGSIGGFGGGYRGGGGGFGGGGASGKF